MVIETQKQKRAKNREKRRAARIARKGPVTGESNGKAAAKKARREAPELLEYPKKTDELVMYDRHKNLIGHE